ncbi:MAG: DUF1800 domain-containing protein [Fimbriimonas sp.]
MPSLLAPEPKAGPQDAVRPHVRLVERLTYGPTAQELAFAAKLGPEAYLQHQLTVAPEVDAALEALIAQRFPRTTWDAHRLQSLGYNNESGDQLIGATLTRRMRSGRQLYERAVEFWTDHFNISLAKTGPALLIQHDRNAIRKHAFGTFPDLLRATAQSPAMLAYLDNDQSNATKPCQNYARELLELHTVGVGVYSQKDVRDVARCFSGWTFVREEARPDFGTFVYDPKRHDDGEKTVLGTAIPAGGGQKDALTVLDLLAKHPRTARRIATKIGRWLIGEGVNDAAVTAIEAAYNATGGDIRAMIRAAVGHETFLTAPRRFKRPAHLFISILRTLNADVQNFQDIRYGYLRQLGHTPFEWPLPNGYPDTMRHWADQMLPRWNFGMALLNNGVGGMQVDFAAHFPPPYNPKHVVQRIEAVLYPAGMDPLDRDDLLKFLSAVPYIDATRSRAAVAVALGMNAFQWY